ncbi:hypothetical protein JCM9279_003436 [Rhodotorula babjevae]
MIVSIDPHKLKPWLIRALEPISDAEPLVLADYVLALLKRDVHDLDELRRFCVHQLDDFLEQHSAAFVDSLLRALQDPDSSAPVPDARGAPPAAPPSSLKRARSPQPAPSSAKLPRTHAGSSTSLVGPPDSALAAGPTTRMVPGMVPGRSAGRLVDRPPCRDYHFRGFCARGSTCPYQHDALPPALHLPAPFPPTFPPSFPPPARPFPPTAHDGAATSSTMRDDPHRRASPGSYPRLAGPPGRQAAPPARPARGTSRVISVDNIPSTSLSEAAIRHFFQPFGPILHLGLDLDGRSATITFSAPHEADRALASPQAVFGNRFVRVYRAVDQGVVPSASGEVRKRDDAGARLVAATPAREGSTSSRPVPASALASTARARQLEQNAEQQRALLDEVQGAGVERKRAIMAALRILAVEADDMRTRTDAETADSSLADPRARLLELQREAASLGIDMNGTSRSDPYLFSRSTTTETRPHPRRYPQQFRLDNRSRNLQISPLGQDVGLSSLRAHLELFGEVVALEHDVEAKAGKVEFALRKSAEQALAAGSLPQEFGAAKLSWAPSGKLSAAAPTTALVDLTTHEPRERESASAARPELGRGDEDMQGDAGAEDEERSWNR